MATEYISRGAVLAKAYWHGDSCTQSNPYPDGVEAVDVSAIEQIPAADVVSAEDYKHLLKIANKMHLWIFMNTGDEQAAYDECGLTDEDNAMLGYGGQYILSPDGENEDAP